MNKSIAGEEVYKIIKEFNYEDKLDILRDCGLSDIIDTHTLIPGTKDFEIKLSTIIDMIIGEYGDKIKFASWLGIKETILKGVKVLNTKNQNKGKEDE